MKLTKRIEQISPSLTLAITAKAKKMKEEGISVIGFGAGEPDFNTPDYIIDAAKKALDDGMTKYTPAAGMLKLQQAISDKLKKDNGLSYEPTQIVISNGAKHSLYNAIMALVEDGGEVIIPAPYWLTYPELVKLAGGVPVIAETCEKNDFKITPEQLQKAITKKTKALILNSPSNPTGSVYSRKELEALSEVVQKSGISVVSDEIYEKLVYDGAEHVSIAAVNPAIKDQVILINGMSKTYSMTGWRIGYLAAPLAVAKAIGSMQSHATSNPNTVAQCASIAALSGGEAFLKQMVETFDARRRYMVERISKIAGLRCIVPKGAFYVFVNIADLFGKTVGAKRITDSISAADIMTDYGVAVVPGVAFGADSYMRLSYAISMEDIREGLDRIEKFVADVK